MDILTSDKINIQKINSEIIKEWIKTRILNILNIPYNILYLLPKSSISMVLGDNPKVKKLLFKTNKERKKARLFHLQLWFYIHLLISLTANGNAARFWNLIPVILIILSGLSSSNKWKRMMKILTLG